MDKKSIFLALFIFIIIAIAFYFAFEDPEIINPPTTPTADEKKADEELEEVRFTVFNDPENQRLELESKRVDNYKEEQRLELFPLKAEVYSTVTGELLYTLTGDFGIYYSSQKYLQVRDNVVVESENYHITAAELDYYMQRDYLEGRGSVNISSDTFNSQAEKFSSDLNLKNLKLFRNENTERAKIKFKETN